MKASAQLFNLLTVLVIGMTAMACLCAGVTFANPQIFFNPLKPHDDALPLLVPTEPTSTPVTPPVSFPTVPPVGTATPAATVTADAPATLAPSATVASTDTGPTATHTPFPSPVGPTETSVPTEPPTRTPTRRPPAATATNPDYPGLPTDTTPAASGTPGAYP